jgi:hypothetical protein
VNNYLVRPQTRIFTMDPCIPLFYGANQDPQGDLEKHAIFKHVSKAEKSEKVPPSRPKNTTSRPSKHQNTVVAKTWFLQYFPHENLVSRAPPVNNSTKKSMQKVTWKQALKNTEFNVSELKKLSKWNPKIKPKSLKILLRTPTCPSCCSHGPPGCPQADKMLSRVVQWRQQASK